MTPGATGSAPPGSALCSRFSFHWPAIFDAGVWSPDAGVGACAARPAIAEDTRTAVTTLEQLANMFLPEGFGFDALHARGNRPVFSNENRRRQHACPAIGGLDVLTI